MRAIGRVHSFLVLNVFSSLPRQSICQFMVHRSIASVCQSVRPSNVDLKSMPRSKCRTRVIRHCRFPPYSTPIWPCYSQFSIRLIIHLIMVTPDPIIWVRWPTEITVLTGLQLFKLTWEIVSLFILRVLVSFSLSFRNLMKDLKFLSTLLHLNSYLHSPNKSHCLPLFLSRHFLSWRVVLRIICLAYYVRFTWHFWDGAAQKH